MTRGLRTARARRAAAFGLIAVLVLLSTGAMVTSWRQAGTADRTTLAARAADLYHEARYLAFAQHTAHEHALARPTDSGVRTTHRSAAAQVGAVLETLRQVDRDEEPTLRRLIEDHHRYLSLTDRFFELAAAGQAAAADELHEGQLEPIEERLRSDLETLSARKRALDMAAHHDLQRSTRALQLGTPVALGVGLLLLTLFALISRSYRRAVETQASHDALTGLPNRVMFQRRCERVLRDARRQESSPVALLLDLNDFKQVNDTLGHDVGDQLLVEVAARLRDGLRADDTVARLGGDEFAVLVPDGGPAAGERVAERIVSLLSRPFVLDGLALEVEASIGIAAAGHTCDVAALIRQADTAMYVAKRFGSRFAHYAAEADHNSLDRITLLSDLRRALQCDEFVLHYQPKIAIHTGELVGVEALARWQHPTRGLVYPDQFIDAIDATHLSHQFTLHVIAKALAHSRAWLDRGRHLPVAVNISSRCLLDERFPEALAAVLSAAGLPPGTLSLELTEGAAMADPARARDVLTRIRALNVRTSIDDFGTGYSSMGYLKLLPIDELKIDRSFVGDMATDATDGILVRSAIELGHNLGLTVVAEGIEDEPTLSVLDELGCDIAQGYLFARPLNPEALATWVDEHALMQSRLLERPADSAEDAAPAQATGRVA